MTVSERSSIEAEALRAGWVMEQRGHGTWFSRAGQKVYTAWSDNGFATYGALAGPDGEVVDRCEFYSRTGVPVIDWIRARLNGEPVPEAEGVAVQPPARLRERLLAEVARLEAMGVAELIGPWGEAKRLKEILTGGAL